MPSSCTTMVYINAYFFELAKCFRESSDPKEVEQLGNQLGRFVFGE
jgi:hypothetical protein